MRRYDPNPSLAVFTILIGGVVGLAVGFVLGLAGIGIVVTTIVGVLVASFTASSLGIVKPRQQETEDDLPSEYDDYGRSRVTAPGLSAGNADTLRPTAANGSRAAQSL